ncbi:MAG: response regulator [candidate division KSB1 bacterium]|nr:response regulator [candidate division KSB1 bacterium]MDZ7345968.1 response regulator [candidate division KSB1 bacterium]
MSRKILLIDDDVDLVEQNRAYLESRGYSVVYAYNGQEGLRLARAEKPDLIVLDVMMTEVGEGFEVARELKADPDTAPIPIIMLSSVNQEHGFNLTIGADAAWNPVDCFIDKPFGPKELEQKITELLKQRNG